MPAGIFNNIKHEKGFLNHMVNEEIGEVDGKTIYAANPSDSKLYVFKRK